MGGAIEAANDRIAGIGPTSIRYDRERHFVPRAEAGRDFSGQG